MSRPLDDTTKPSRLNRRRKKRWRVSDLIEAGLTDCARVTMLFTAGTSSTGRGNLVKLWRKVAATYSGFFMPVIQRGLAPFAFCYGGLFWAAFGAGWLHNPVFHPIAARRPMPWKASAAVQSSVMEQPL